MNSKFVQLRTIIPSNNIFDFSTKVGKEKKTYLFLLYLLNRIHLQFRRLILHAVKEYLPEPYFLYSCTGGGAVDSG